ncbi:hypothetical protein K469DRAFT_558170 [Zopfia rhizophila CBS 207.26]|uniref:Uncharacterized protein n=1 Tax=Zopfia rhizophila CBS 207.26 TaxID=1314779 RepID=A0A6A6EMF1_9PEZI|nr:hypothetical protein K469DRAFT_558170 [Zopfia rhizophila CBS 207.26]
MAKRNSDGDVLVNRVNVALAKSQRLLASMLGPKTEDELKTEKTKEEREKEDMEEDVQAPECLGIGVLVPKNIEDGSFTRRAPTSNDRVLETLVGRKAAKAHIASKQAPKQNAQSQKVGCRPLAKRTKAEESEDEEEGRAAAFRSKRQKMNKVPSSKSLADVDGERAEQQDTELLEDPRSLADTKSESNMRRDAADSRRQVPKLGSYLDEVLAERAKKKKKKCNKEIKNAGD